MKISVTILALVVCFCFAEARNIRSKRSKFDLSELTRDLKALERQLEQTQDDDQNEHVCEKEVSKEIKEHVADKAGDLVNVLDKFLFELRRTSDVFGFDPYRLYGIPNMGDYLYIMYECMNNLSSVQEGEKFVLTAVNDTLGLAELYRWANVPDANKFTVLVNEIVEKTVAKYFSDQPKPAEGGNISAQSKRSYSNDSRVNQLVEGLCNYGRRHWHPVVNDMKEFLELGMFYMKMSMWYMHSLQVISTMQAGKRFIVNTAVGICHGASLVHDKAKLDEFLFKADMVYEEVKADVIKKLQAGAQQQQEATTQQQQEMPDVQRRIFSLPKTDLKRMMSLFSKK